MERDLWDVSQTLSAEHPVCFDEVVGSNGVNSNNLCKADNMDAVDLLPENEVVGEMIFFQQQLLRNAVTLKRQSGQFFVPADFLFQIMIFASLCAIVSALFPASQRFYPLFILLCHMIIVIICCRPAS